MPKFGTRSREKLNNLNPIIVEILEEAIEIYDFSVVQTIRTEEQHLDYLERGMTTISFSKTKHRPRENGKSDAVDLAPYPIDWKDENRFMYMAGVIISIAHRKNVKIRWGGDWNRNGDFEDQSFDDLPHFEIIE